MLPFMWNLESVDLSDNGYNYFGHLSETFGIAVFPPMQNMKVLDIKRSYIETIHEKTFDPLISLTRLNLTGNNLTSVPRGVLKKSIQVLDLSNQSGAFTNLPNGAFNSSISSEELELQSLSLSQNKISRIHKDSFLGLKNLQDLQLSNCNALQSIDENAFEHTPNLKKLDLSFNRNLTGITDETLAKLSNLQDLNLAFSSNALFDKSKGVSVTNLNLLQNLQVLNVSCALNTNCYTSDEYESPVDPAYLQALTKLQVLDMSQNSLGEWKDDRFAKNINLQNLYLNHNRMAHLTQGLIDSFARLKEIDFRHNKLECDEFIVIFFNLTLSKPELKVKGWKNGDGYLCRNMTDNNLTQITFRQHYDWFIQVPTPHTKK